MNSWKWIGKVVKWMIYLTFWTIVICWFAWATYVILLAAGAT